MEYVQLTAAVLAGCVSVSLLRFAFKLVSYDRIEYEKSRARYSSLKDAISGRAKVKRSELPDGRVRAGIVYNSRKGRIEANGKLRNDIVDNVA
jgi:hypothetical protein